MARELDRLLTARKARMVKKHGGGSAMEKAMAKRRSRTEGDPENREPAELDEKGRQPTEGEHQDTMVELGNEFSQRAKREADRVDDAITGDFYAVIYFQTPDQLKEFLDKSTWMDLATRQEGDNKRFFDGLDVAKIMNIEIVNKTPPSASKKNAAKRWTQLAKTIAEDYAEAEEN